jgi:hypothetical protein
MSLIARFAEYAAAFEKAFESDDWSVVEPFFDEAAVYEVGLPLLGTTRCEGRAAVLAWFREVLDRFDRRFDSRELALLEGPKEENGEVWIRGSATYRAKGLPDFVLVLKETVRFKGDRIVHLEDEYSDEMIAETEAFMRAHGPKIGFEIARDEAAD